jgi:L-fucose mutarotase/ribose pyranase (RbsD/FucU family)
VVFIGKHIYQNRIAKDGYTIEDVIDQITSAMHPDSLVLDTSKMTAMENPDLREDRYGNKVRDRAVFECTVRHPRPELFSVIPRGDLIKPQKRKGHSTVEWPFAKPERLTG